MKKTLCLIWLYALLSFTSQSVSAQKAPTIEELEQQLASTPQADSMRIRILINLYNQYSAVLSKDKSRAAIEEAVTIARQFANPLWLAKTLIIYSNVHIADRQYPQAAAVLKEALELSEANTLPKMEAQAYTNMGMLYVVLEAWPKAVSYLGKAYEKAVEIKNDNMINIGLLNLGAIHGIAGNHKDALVKYKKCLEAQKLRPNWDLYAVLYQNIGIEYTKLEQWDKAKIALDSAHVLIAEHDLSKIRQLNVDGYLAELYIKGFNDPNKAIAIWTNIVETSNNALSAPVLADTHKSLAQAYLKVNNPQAAIKHALICRDLIITKVVDVEKSIASSQVLAESHAALQNWQDAYKWSHEANILRDIFTKQQEKRLAAFALISHEIDSNEAELNKKNAQLHLTKTIYETIGFLLIPLLIILLAAIYYRVKLVRSRERIKLQAEYTSELEQKVTERTKDLEQAHTTIQEAKERENISLAMLNQQHSELLELTVEKMQNWQRQNTFTEIQSTINDLKAAQTKADEWGSFMLHFERIHPNFAQSLHDQFPDLNANELKHCAYMRLGMSRKQVADNLHTTENAVRLARNRIRKKMGLEADDSLQGFLDQWGDK